MWFKYELSDGFNHIFMLAPAKLTSKPKNMSIFDSVSSEIHLQLVQANEAQASIDQVLSFNFENAPIEARSPLPESLAREFAYEKIKASDKGRRIKGLAQLQNLKCPGTRGSAPCDVPFSSLSQGYHFRTHHLPALGPSFSALTRDDRRSPRQPISNVQRM